MVPSNFSESEWRDFLAENGLVGKAKRKHHAAYRKIDGKLVTGFAVKHTAGAKKEILFTYKGEVLKALKELEELERTNEAVDTQGDAKSEEWKTASWYEQQVQMMASMEDSEGQEEGGT